MSAQRRTAIKQRTAAPRPAEPSPARPVAATRSAKPAPKGEPVAKPSIIAVRTQAIRQLARDVWAEAKKVNWPDKETTRNLTIVVIAISVVLGLFLGGIDYLLLKLLEAF
ncbi:MAG TPA: preprotein translocase subunit SecE [Thermomicrobiales bacterium]